MATLEDVLSRFFDDRRSVRAPVPLFQKGYGWLLGGRLFLLEHRGRRSGEPRYAILEVVERPAPNVVRTIAGMGRRSKWYRNVVADSRVRLTVGGGEPIAATARELSAETGRAVLEEYAERHPRAAEALWPIMARNCPPGQEFDEAFPVIEFELDRAPEPPHVQAWHQFMGPVGRAETAAALAAGLAVAIAAGSRPDGPGQRVLRAVAGWDVGGGLVAFALPTTRQRYAKTSRAARIGFTAAHVHPLVLQPSGRSAVAYAATLAAADALSRLPHSARVPAGVAVAVLVSLVDSPRDWLMVAMRLKLLAGHGSLPDPPVRPVRAECDKAAARPV